MFLRTASAVARAAGGRPWEAGPCRWKKSVHARTVATRVRDGSEDVMEGRVEGGGPHVGGGAAVVKYVINIIHYM